MSKLAILAALLYVSPLHAFVLSGVATPRLALLGRRACRTSATAFPSFSLRGLAPASPFRMAGGAAEVQVNI